MRILIATAALMLAAPAVAQTTDGAPSPTRLVLADAASAPTGRTIIDGAAWRCEPTGACVATGGSSQPATRACRRVVARLGAVTEFSWKGVTLDEAQLATCNA